MKDSDIRRILRRALRNAAAPSAFFALVLASKTGCAAQPPAANADTPAPAPTAPAEKLAWKGEMESPSLTFQDWLGNPAGLPAPKHSEMEALFKHLVDTENKIKDLLQTMVNNGKISFKRAQAHLDQVARPEALSLERWDALRHQLDGHEIADADYAASVFQFHQLAQDLKFRRAALLAQVRSAVADNSELPGDPVQPDTGRPQTAKQVINPTMQTEGQKSHSLAPTQVYTPPPPSTFYQR